MRGWRDRGGEDGGREGERMEGWRGGGWRGGGREGGGEEEEREEGRKERRRGEDLARVMWRPGRGEGGGREGLCLSNSTQLAWLSRPLAEAGKRLVFGSGCWTLVGDGDLAFSRVFFSSSGLLSFCAERRREGI